MRIIRAENRTIIERQEIPKRQSGHPVTIETEAADITSQILRTMLKRHGTEQIEIKTALVIEVAAHKYKKQRNRRIKTININVK